MKTNKTAYRWAVGLALAAAFILVWLIGAIGVIGAEGDLFDLMYFGVFAVGIIGAFGTGANWPQAKGRFPRN